MPMNWTLPAVTSNYSTEFVPSILNAWQALSVGLDPTYAGTLTNIPTGAKRWNAGDIQQWNGTTWAAFTTVFAKLAGPAFTGNPTATTQAVNNNSTRLATTAFVLGQAATATPLMAGAATIGVATRFAREDHRHPSDTAKANLASPAFTGTPTAPTAAANTNTTQLATTAFVLSQAGTATPLMAGAATIGVATRFAREDHRHPTDTSRAPLASPALTGTATYNGLELGTRRVPINLAAGAYTLVASDAAKCVARDSNVTIPSGVFAAGDTVIVYNNDTVANSLIAGASTTVILAGIGSTGTRTMAPRALVSIVCVASNTFVVSGAGLT
jgi:hypothetical protein